MNPLRPKNRLRLTYATRGMEPMRGFPNLLGLCLNCLNAFPIWKLLSPAMTVLLMVQGGQGRNIWQWARGQLRRGMRADQSVS